MTVGLLVLLLAYMIVVGIAGLFASLGWTVAALVAIAVGVVLLGRLVWLVVAS